MSWERPATSALELVNSSCRPTHRTYQRADTGTNKTYSLLALRSMICSSRAMKRDKDDAYFTLFAAGVTSTGGGAPMTSCELNNRQSPSAARKASWGAYFILGHTLVPFYHPSRAR